MSFEKTGRGFTILVASKAEIGPFAFRKAAPHSRALMWLFHDDAPCSLLGGEHFRPSPT